MSMNARMDNELLVRMLVLVGMGALAIMVLGSAGATITGDAPPATGDWVVNSNTAVTGETIYVDGNLTVNGNLDLRDSTLVMNITTPWQYNIEVSSTGRITATDTTFSSNHTTAGYGFRVWGRVDLLRCRVTETEDGLRILTSGVQTITSTTIDDFHLGGLYLEDADGTTLTDVFIQSDRYEATVTAAEEVRESGQHEFFYVPETGAFHIKGGQPSIDGLSMSVNGSLMVSATFDLYPAKAAQNQIRIFSLVALIETDQVLDISRVGIRDCTFDFSSHYDVNEHTTLAAGRHTIINNYYLCPMVLHDSAGASFSDVTAMDVRIGTTSVTFTTNGALTKPTENSKGTWAITALSTEIFDDTNERAISLEVIDSTFERLAAIYVYIASIGLDENLTRLALDLNVDSITIEESPTQGCVQIDNAIAYRKDLEFRLEMAVTNSTFTANANTLIMVSLGGTTVPYRGKYPTTPKSAWAYIYDNITIRDNLVSGNFGNGILITAGGSAGRDAGLSDTKLGVGGVLNAHIFEYMYIEDNVFEDHNAATGPIQMTGMLNPHLGKERVFVRNNEFKGSVSATGTSTLVSITGKEFVRIQENTFTDNSKSSAITVNTMGGDAETPEPADVIISNNTFLRNRFWNNNELYMGIMVLKVGGDVEVTHNTIVGDESRAFVNIQEVVQYTGYGRFDIHHNEIVDSPDMTGIIFLRTFDVYHSLLTVILRNNMVRDCGAATLMDFYDWGPTLDSDDFDATIEVRSNTVINATEQVIRAHGKVKIVNNTFKNCRGYVINIQYLNEHIPEISGNVFDGCHHLIYLGAKAKALGGLPIMLEGLDIDCSGNGLKFSNMQAVLNNVVVSANSYPAIIAENSVVSIVGGDVEVGSGRIIGTGSITRFHVLEAHVTWTNATSVDSGMPAVDVPVMLLDAEGRLALTRTTDDEGNLASVLVPAWSIRAMFVIRHTPHTLLIGPSGIARSIDLVFDHDFVGVDALEVNLLDDRIPVVGITAPVSGQHFRTDVVTVTGFVLEMGSGIDWIRLTVEDGVPMDVETDRSGTFEHHITGLDEGTIEITLSARDIAGNLQSRQIQINIDMTSPDILIDEPRPGIVTSEPSIDLVVLVEPGNMVYINGQPQSLDGGKLTTSWPLTEGENIIILKAVDVAGNVVTETITVTRDSMLPHLLLLGPVDGLLTNDPSVEVRGETEPGMEAWLLVLDGTVELQNISIEVGPEGTFSESVDLDEGTYDLLLTCRDGAMNIATGLVTVTVDTTPPGVAITSPSDGWLSRGGTVHVTGTADTGARVYVNGMPVVNDGGIDHVLLLDEGVNVVEMMAVDAAANTATSSITVTVDSQPPIIMLTSPMTDHVMISEQTLEITGTILGDLAILTVMGDEVSVAGIDGAFATTVTLTEEGVTRVVIRATDTAGNFREMVLTVDAGWTPPTIEVGKEVEGDKAVLDCTVTGDCVELLVIQTSASGDTTRRVLVEDDGTYTVICDLAKGDNTIVVRAVDGHGGFTESAPVNVAYSPAGTEEEESAWGALELGVILLAFGLAFVVTILVMGRYGGGRPD